MSDFRTSLYSREASRHETSTSALSGAVGNSSSPMLRSQSRVAFTCRGSAAPAGVRHGHGSTYFLEFTHQWLATPLFGISLP
jgi:hypothetical protein